MNHAAPWWYRLAARLFPGRCREIPDALDPDRVLLRQVAIVRRHVYLQGFASGESRHWYHCHQWGHLFVFGLWGSYSEDRPNRPTRRVRAPYFLHFTRSDLHRVRFPSRGHTSIAIGTREVGERFYFANPIHWTQHVKRRVKRL